MKRILICPVCKSKDVELDAGGYTGKYYCKNCGYVGSFVLEMTKGEYKEMMEKEKFERIEDEKSKPKGVRED
ncbi:MAG: TFIIB-type zinc ribbon-containing protein [Archaeoglobus sp.]|uniref:TFIIB-type zinc ribbon-containing protein n=1 Tax=Archaeoglobus sp. TaxID=1872626 RepID=UPI001D30B009|nr:TFIIB-type zinc ribbon-containing protein [Archaeoglobus sp.]MBO8178866.1 TFIIB-type zinc ribbon-containing protein [Archaeoglobus sp.]